MGDAREFEPVSYKPAGDVIVYPRTYSAGYGDIVETPADLATKALARGAVSMKDADRIHRKDRKKIDRELRKR